MKQRRYSDKVAVAANQNRKDREYWLQKLSGGPVKSSFPYDFSTGTTGERTAAASVHKFNFQPGLFAKTQKLSGGIDLKLQMILVTALTALLHRYTPGNDILVGVPILKQEKEADFINRVLVLRNGVNEGITFRELLIQVKDTVIEAADHQDFPMEVLPDLLKIPVYGDDFPLFDTVFLLENIHDKDYLKGFLYNMLFCFRRLETGIEGSVEYNSRLYGEETVVRLTNHFMRLLDQALSDVNAPLTGIDILTEAERHQLLTEFNGEELEVPQDKTFQQLFEEQVERTPGNTAVVGPGSQLNYLELDEKAGQLAAVLREQGVGSDTIVAIQIHRCVEMIVGVLGIMKAGGAYLPIDPDYPQDRIDYMLADSNAKIVLDADSLSKSPLERALEGPRRGTPKGWGVSTLAHSPENLAYVIYTSGSTGRPKGVMVQHDHLVNVAMGWRKEYRLQEMDVNLLQMASFSFDVFAGDLARTFLNGGKMVINPDAAVPPETLYDLITTHRVTLFESTPSYIIPFMDYVYENGLAMDSLQLLIFGSDSCPVRDYKRMLERFGDRMRIVNSYGVTEATIDSSYYEEAAGGKVPALGSVPIGSPLPNMQFYIMDAHQNLLPIGVVGELYIGGASVTRGYLNNPELTDQKFISTPLPLLNVNRDTRSSTPLYRTGDLARWLPPAGVPSKGSVEFLGRIDNQVKVRGYRIELGEIESRLLEHPHIKEAVVVNKEEESGDKFLCGYITTAEPVKSEDLRDFLARSLPDYMIPWFYVHLEQLPLTPNGKVDRKGLPEPESSGTQEYVAPRDGREQGLVEVWSRVLAVEPGQVGIDTNFFDLGGNSLKAIIMTARIHKAFNVKLELTDIFKLQTIRELALLIGSAGEDRYTPLEKAPEKEYYQLSSPQMRLYIVQQGDPANTGYNMPFTLILEGDLDREKLEEAFRQMIRRHESLRTSFHMVDDVPVQKIHRDVIFEISGDIGVRPFDLSQPPLMRTGLEKTGRNSHIFMLDLHHIITDGISTGILIRELSALYDGAVLPELKIQYKDFSEWSHHAGQKERIEKQGQYWREIFSVPVPVLELPTDYTRPAKQSFEGETLEFRVSEDDARALDRLASEEDATLFMALLALFYILLAKASGREDIVIGTPIAGRGHADLEHVVGMFLNTLALRNYPAGEKTFSEFLREVKTNTLAAFENQDYPFEDLVEQAGIKKDPSRNPLFDVMFMFRGGQGMSAHIDDIPRVELTGLKLKPYFQKAKTSKFDLTLWADDNGSFTFEFCTKLFKKETIETYGESFKRIITSVLSGSGVKLSDMEIVSETEQISELSQLTDDLLNE
ncbi:MAG: amino acid adenylation domain-containing protein [bacterium]|nr:amino acid adenylation domain-containing protein [bacterium]